MRFHLLLARQEHSWPHGKPVADARSRTVDRLLTPFVGLQLLLLLFAAGCTHKPTSVNHVEVSGKVLYKGKPLPGGRVTFVATNGAFADSGNIEEDGTYKLNAPVGPVKISVNNQMLRVQHAPVQNEEMMKRSGNGELHPIKGTFVAIPNKYYDAEASGLTYTVEPEPQKHDINLD
jgi:hypothetical protein